MNDPTAINERYPAPFEGLNYKEARGLVNEAIRLTDCDDDIDEALLWEIRIMPGCLRCGALLSPRYPLGGHDETCSSRTHVHLRVVR